ncbi:hypothetical protein FB566_4960 [Stackebrandtia endophytica]|uniref:Peptidase inhibitor family I36 n=1 Tax=Stackebrandtia endophytica TaxID=1496996 RepID=A0A543B3F0_9ACTN|nr:DUF6289 family protein [Stackebrandtia endophytica]TQL79359.1 hypothetical protein FB566_4960 [Stackebrandtia endophytica]
MTRTKRAVYAAVAASAIATSFAVAAATPAMAIPACRDGYQCTYTWYTDADKTSVSGGMTIFCDGTQDRFGTQTSYLTFSTAQCND